MVHVLKKVLVVAAFLSYIVAIVFNALAGLNKSDLFNGTTNSIFKDNFVEGFTPAPWVNNIWIPIYIFQALFLIYSMATVFCCGAPNFIPSVVYVCYIINMGCNIGYLFLLYAQKHRECLGILIVMDITLYIALGGVMYGLKKHAPDMLDSGLGRHLKMSIPFALNALAIYAAWVTILTDITLGMVLCHPVMGAVSSEEAGLISLGLLAFQLVFYVCLDQGALFRHFQKVFAPFIVVTVMLLGIYIEHSDRTPEPIFALALLAAELLVVVFKIVRMCIGCRTGKQYEGGEGGYDLEW